MIPFERAKLERIARIVQTVLEQLDNVPDAITLARIYIHANMVVNVPKSDDVLVKEILKSERA